MRARRPAAGPIEWQPMMPYELMVYSGPDWGAPPPPPAGADLAAYEAFEAGGRAAYKRWQTAVDAWRAEHGWKPVDESAVRVEFPETVPWDGEFDD